ncbi:MAG: helix-turn-helix domain-containing protein [Ornithinibacter sp.]
MSERMVVRRGSDIGLAIAEARRSRGLSQQGLAELSGIERTYLARLEAGHSVVLVERALRTLRRLGAEVVIELPGP